MPALLEFFGVYGLVLFLLKSLYALRRVSFIGGYLPALAALILIYIPVLHASVRKSKTRFFEHSSAAVGRSLRCFLLASLAVFPAFLVLNHLYQALFFGATPHTGRLAISAHAALFQIFVIAFPEELFFRGYLQEALSQRYSRKIRLFGSELLSVSLAVPLTSLLFAFSHTFITFRWWHFAIFFPSLIFGWLREKTGGMIAPTLFHALSNLIVMGIGMTYH